MLIFNSGLVLAHDFLVETQDLSVRTLVVYRRMGRAGNALRAASATTFSSTTKH